MSDDATESTPSYQTSEAEFNKIKRSFEAKEEEKDVLSAEALRQQSETTTVSVPTSFFFPGNKIELSSFDVSSLGRSIGLVWSYATTLDTTLLLSSLTKMLVLHPMLCGRYDGSQPPTWVACNNAGVPVRITTWSDPNASVEVATHLTTTTSCTTTPTVFPVDQHSPFVPDKQGMDPDTMSAAVPLFKVKVTVFPKGGTTLGILCQHGILDVEAIVTFMINWSRVYRELGLEPAPNHDRMSVNGLEVGAVTPSTDAANEWSTTASFHSVPMEEKSPPEFVGQLPAILGNPKDALACVVPFPQSMCTQWTEAARLQLPDGPLCSTDDVLTARVWQAMTAMRISQLGLGADSAHTTTVARTFNGRQRTTPPLGPGYCGNATTSVRTSMTVKECLSFTPSEIAVRLCADMQSTPAEMIPVRAKWLTEQYALGHAVSPVYDDKALTFMIHSWNFPWESVHFESMPLSFDHGCLEPIVAVITPRPKSDGMQVSVCGPNAQDMNDFATMVVQSEKEAI